MERIYWYQVRDLSDKSNIFGKEVNSFESSKEYEKGDFVRDGEGRMKEIQSISDGNTCVRRGTIYTTRNLFINGKL